MSVCPRGCPGRRRPTPGCPWTPRPPTGAHRRARGRRADIDAARSPVTSNVTTTSTDTEGRCRAEDVRDASVWSNRIPPGNWCQARADDRGRPLCPLKGSVDRRARAHTVRIEGKSPLRVRWWSARRSVTRSWVDQTERVMDLLALSADLPVLASGGEVMIEEGATRRGCWCSSGAGGGRARRRALRPHRPSGRGVRRDVGGPGPARDRDRPGGRRGDGAGRGRPGRVPDRAAGGRARGAADDRLAARRPHAVPRRRQAAVRGRRRAPRAWSTRSSTSSSTTRAPHRAPGRPATPRATTTTH